MSFQEVEIKTGKEFLNCKLFKSVNHNNVSVVVVHGWTSSDKKYLPLGEILRTRGFNVLTINLRGHLNSPYNLEKYSRKDHETDILCAIKYVRSEFPDDKLVLLGKSYGGYLSSVLANQAKVDYLILSQPALYPDKDYDVPTKELIELNPNIFKQANLSPSNNKAIRELSKFKNPVLFIESEIDEEVPQATTDNYLEYAPANLKRAVIKNSDHALTKDIWRTNFYSTVEKWLKQIVK